MVGLFSFSSYAFAVDPTLVGHWNFDEGSGATVADDSGSGNNGDLVGVGVSFSNAQVAPIVGANPYSLQFDGSSDTGVHVADSSSLDMSTAITALAWIYWDGTAGDNVVIDKSNTLGGDTPNYRLILKGNGKLALWNGTAAVESTGTVTSNTWTLVNFTIDASTTQFFINGVAAGGGNIGLGAPTNYDLLIGRDAMGRYFHGYIDEVSIYNRILTGNEISGLAGNPTIEFISPTPDDASSQAMYPEVSLLTADSTNGHYSFTDFDNSLIGWYKFDNETADDSSPTAFHGILQNGTYTTSGKFGGAAVFNGTSTYVDTLLPSSVSDHYTMSVWVKLNNPTWSGALVSDANGHLLQIGGSNVWQFNGAYGTATADTGVWTHLVGVYNGGQEILYVNGTVAATSWGNRSMDQHINIGRRMDGFYIDGQIDDVVFFDRALGADEVASLYDATETQYDHFFINTSSGEHTFTGYVADMDGNIATTEERTVTLTAPTLTEVTPIPSQVRASRAKYYFSVDGDIEDYDYLAENCGDIETIVDPINHIVSFGGLKSGHEYGNCSFGMYSSTGPATNALYIGAFTITPEPASVVGGHALETIAPAPILSNTNLCPTDQILTFPVNIKKLQAHLVRLGFTVGPIDGISGPMTKNAIKQAQKKLGTLTDGLVGPITRGLINNSCTK